MCRNRETRIFIGAGKSLCGTIAEKYQQSERWPGTIREGIRVLAEERQCVITLACKRSITATDMESQLSPLTMQEISLKHELSSLGQAISINALNNWEASVNEYLTDLQAGIEELNNAAPQTEEERREIFRLKKRVVDTLVKRITIDRDRELSLEIRLNLLDIIEEEPNSSVVHLGEDGIYTHIPDIYPATQLCVVL